MEELKNEVNQETVEEKDPAETWSDIARQADLEMAETEQEESSGGGKILLILGGVAAVGGIAYGAVKLVKKIWKRKEQTPSEDNVIDGEAFEVEEETETDEETAEPDGKNSDMDSEPEKSN